MANQISMIEKSAGTQYAIKTVPMRIMKCTNTHGVRRPYLSEKQHLNLSCAHPETESPVADQKYNPTEISILSYDAVGLVYYAWKQPGEIKSVNDFNFKKDIKGKVGKFNIKDNKVIQKLKVYRIKDGNFIEYKF